MMNYILFFKIFLSIQPSEFGDNDLRAKSSYNLSRVYTVTGFIRGVTSNMCTEGKVKFK